MNSFKIWMTGLIALISFAFMVGTSVAASIYFTAHQLHNECDALNLLTKTPVPKPPDPKANPSRETTYLFYLALIEWKTKDGCL